ncbi:MAG: transposase zinc-binding domain-containing protein [Coprococcus phoceensis]
MNCKTGAYGANVSVCEDCSAVQIHYNSCRNRCCPMMSGCSKGNVDGCPQRGCSLIPLTSTGIYCA